MVQFLPLAQEEQDRSSAGLVTNSLFLFPLFMVGVRNVEEENRGS